MLTEAERKRLRAGADSVGVSLSPLAEERIATHLRLLREWGERTNLVARGDEGVLIERHVVDSLAAVPLLRASLGERIRIADLGSGAGFPGIPLAIALEQSHVTLVESRRRRASFLRAAARQLGLALEVAHQDVAAFAAQNAGAFDGVVSRAAFSREDLLRHAALLLREGGIVVSFKGVPSSETPSERAIAGTEPGSHFSPLPPESYRLPGRSSSLILTAWTRNCST
jgi:16S rRNA (guanine527-N7)-methyltransferase